MSSLSIQFFATTDELASFVNRWMAIDGLHAAAVEYQPYLVSPMVRRDVQASVQCERVRQLIFTERPVDCSASGNNQLLDKNEGALVLEIGRIGRRGLAESHLSTMNATKRWRKIAADLKRSTAAGMVGTHEQSGASARYRSERYSPGAAELERSGTPLRPFEQSAVLLRPFQ